MTAMDAIRRQWQRKLKPWLRGVVPGGLWSGGSTLVRWFSQASSRAFAAGVALVLWPLPDRFTLTLRSRLELLRPLDYDGATIRLRVTSPTELDVRLRSCAKEPETVDWLSRTFTPQSVLYDVGANVGAYALVAASVTRGAGTVYAFEPGSETYASLVENIRANGHTAAITPFPLALGATTGVARFAYSSLEAGAARHPGIMPGSSDANGAVSTVLCYRLDDFIREFGLKQPTHMKIDVDGAEPDVIQGAAETLKSPGLSWVLVEVDVDDASSQALRRELEGLGFVLESDTPHVGYTHNWIFARGGR